MDGKSEPLTSIPEMAKILIEGLQKIQPQGPYYLAGMCFGGIVAFEIAQQLVRSGESVAFLGVLDSNFAPQKRKHLAYYRMSFKKFIYDHILRRQIPIGDLLPRRNRRTHQVEDTYTQRIYHVFTANLYGQFKYTSSPYPGLITKFSTEWGVAERATIRWQKNTTVGLEDHIVPGVHSRRNPDDTRMLDEPNVQVVAEKLRECLERATP
jgi:thioesterase domain-containing protein